MLRCRPGQEIDPSDPDVFHGARQPMSRFAWLMAAAVAIAIAASTLGAPDSPSLAFLAGALEHLVR